MRIILLLLLSVTVMKGYAQTNLTFRPTNKKMENITIEKLGGDSLSTAFHIQIVDEVQKHYHAFHSEHVYIIEGEGWFYLGQDSSLVRQGDYLFIPKGEHHAVKVTSKGPMRALSVQSPEFLGNDRVKVP